MDRYFGAIGYPPEVFFKTAVQVVMQEGPADGRLLKDAWRKLSERERHIFGMPRFKRPWTRRGIKEICLHIIEKYGARLTHEMTPPSLHRLEKILERRHGLARKYA